MPARFSFWIFLIVGFSIVMSCASPGQKIYYQRVKQSLIRGRTIQGEVIALLGSPTFASRNSSGEEVWTYNRKIYDPDTGNTDEGVVLSGGVKPSASGNYASAFDLLVTFDRRGVLRDYSLVSDF